MSEKIIQKGNNKGGVEFLLTQIENGNYLVRKLCSNYNGKVKGGISHSYRICTTHAKMNHTEFQTMAREGLSKTEAEKLFNKKLKTKAKH